MALFNIPHPDTEGFPTTNLKRSYGSGVTAFLVNNTAGLSATDYGLVTTYGVQSAEIVQLNGGLTDTGFNLAAATAFPHGIDSQFTYLPYNQIAIEYSSNLTTLIDSNLYTTIIEASDAATWSALATIDIEPSQLKTPYNDGSTTSRAYRYRFYNATTAAYSTYSDPILPNGYEERTAGRLIEDILLQMRTDVGPTRTDKLSYEELFRAITRGSNDIAGKRKKWSHRHSWDQYFSDIIPGRNYVYLPRNIDVNYTNRSLEAVRIKDGKRLDYVDKAAYDEAMENVHHSISQSELNTASTDWELEDTSNLDDSGSTTVIVSGDRMVITYTANNRTTNILTTPNCATEVTTTIPVETDVWQGATFSSKPTEFTVKGRAIYFTEVPDETLYQRTLNGDYIETFQRINSESDMLREANLMALFYYALYALEDSLDNNKSQSYLALYRDEMETMKKNETSGQRHGFTINIRPLR